MAFDVFISYALKDGDVARSICERLESGGFNCWIAPRNIEVGVPYGEAIIQGIEQSRSLLLVFSQASNSSPQVQREIERAVSRNEPLLTVRIEDQRPTASLEYFLCNHHWFDLFPDSNSKLLSALVQAVRRSLDRQSNKMPMTAEEHPRLTPMDAAVRNNHWWYWGIGSVLAVSILLAIFLLAILMASKWNRPLQAIPAAPSTSKPDSPPGEEKPNDKKDGTLQESLAGTTWIGSESAIDTNALKFVFGLDNEVTAYDETHQTWRGTWALVGEHTVVIQLTEPNAVNYIGQIQGDRISGEAGRPGASGQWSWSVHKRSQL